MEARQGATSGWTLRIAAYAAAFGFCSVSLYANARFGSTLGSGAADRITYIVVSLSADLFKIAAPVPSVDPKRALAYTLTEQSRTRMPRA